MKSFSLEGIINGAKEGLNSLASNSRRLASTALLTGALTAGAVGGAQAQERYVNFDADPAAFGINGETINLTDFEVQYFMMPNPDQVGFRMVNTENPLSYVEVRGVVPLANGETFTLDGIMAAPYITVDASTVGSVAPPTEMPGSNPGVDNIYELDSSMQFGSPFFRLRDNMGTVVHAIDKDGSQTLEQENLDIESIHKWNRAVPGYNVPQLSEVVTFQSSQGNPEGWSPGQLKVWKDVWVSSGPFNGDFDLNNATVTYNSTVASMATYDEEGFSKMIARGASPFANQVLAEVPDAYILMVAIQNHSDIYNAVGGVQQPVIPIGFYDSGNGIGLGMYAPGADDGSGQFPGSISNMTLLQRDDLNSDGSVQSTIYEPPVQTESSSFGGWKAKF